MYYEIWVNTNKYKKSEALTYDSNEDLSIGDIVTIPFKDQIISGVIAKKINKKPDFKTKSIISKILNKPLPVETVNLLNWMTRYYPAPVSSHIQLFIPGDVAKMSDSATEKEVTDKLTDLNLPVLTNEQKYVTAQIMGTKSRTILLHGDTGTGKTRVYVELIHKKLTSGKSVILLTPEIGLTPQLFQVMKKSFGKRVVMMHSALSSKVKHENWLKIFNSKEPLLVIGPRSALFAPVQNLGLIIIDEAHEASYKQEQAPYYQTTRVAAKLAEISKAELLLGTATPLVSDYYFLEAKGLLKLRMTELATNTTGNLKLPNIEIINLTERNNFSKSNWLSNQLIQSISKSLSDHEQSLVFLNRRGTALVILCKNCGWQALCPNCDTSLTYHGDNHTMNCHSCSFSGPVPAKCPICSSHDIIFKGAGTKAVEQELIKLFPSSVIKRFDRDNKKSESLAENYNDVLSGKIDILVGTQIITKGLDLPKLSTVGIIMADNNLYFPDYTAEELTYQMLTQVIGRVARGHTDGRVIVQTYNPSGIALKSAVDKKYDQFYMNQLDERRKFRFPPFVFLLKLSTKKANSINAQKASESLITDIKALGLPILVSGPAPGFHKRIQGKYVWQVIVKSTDRESLVRVVEQLPANWNYDIDPSSLL